VAQRVDRSGEHGGGRRVLNSEQTNRKEKRKIGKIGIEVKGWVRQEE
jgi:hypothetical protein